jgi:hypothetical protein
MEIIKVRCKNCNRELEGHTTKTVSCGCSNMTTIRGEKISALDLSKVVMLNNYKEEKKKNFLTQEDVAWQQARRDRKVRKLDFEIR